MKKELFEELQRIHKLNYKKDEVVNTILETIKSKNIFNEVDDPKKADLLSTNVQDFYNTLKGIDTLSQQNYGSMTYQKEVEALQVALMMLGYDLPRFGADGFFGKETAAAISKFKQDNGLNGQQQVNEAALAAPVDISRVTSDFGEKRGEKEHSGVDLAVPSGTPIKSPLDGKILTAEFRESACGGTIQIDHGNGYISRYCHCSSIKVNPGQTVKQGQVVGLSGGGKGEIGAGSSTGPHVHMELKVNGQLVDPLKYINREQLVTQKEPSTLEKIQQADITPDIIKVLIDKVMNLGVEPSDLSGYVDASDMSNLSDNQAYTMLLKQLNAPVTDENMKFLYAWRQSEGRLGLNNPFNTTYVLPNSKRMNKHGVRSYATVADGIRATVRTLNSTKYDYSCIVDGLKNNIGAKNIAKCDALIRWGTGDLVQKVLNGYERGASPKIKPLN
jgi:murein DD-endopeptidase MepM/ murein hydrolase activator NlpD